MLRHQQLEHALALYRHGSFRRAAEAVQLSQPAFSRSIRALEEQLGVVLFDRHPGAVKPTVFGTVLLRRAQSIIDEAEELEREIGLFKGLEAGKLAVAMGPYPCEMSGGRAAGELLRRHPSLTCRFSLADWRTVGDQVLSRAVDLGFAEVSDAQTNDELVTELVGQHRLVFFCRAGHPLANIPEVSKTEMDLYPLVGVGVPPRIAPEFPGGATARPSSGRLVPTIEVEDAATARAIVSASDALSAAAPSKLDLALRTGEFVCLPFRTPILRFNYGFIYRRNRMRSPAAEVFMQRVRAIEEDLAVTNRRLEEELLSVRPENSFL